jgi:phosphate transport system substrate-binding protein
MKSSLRKIMLVIALAAACAGTAPAQDARGLLQLLPKDVVQELRRQVIAEVKSEVMAEMKRELLRNGATNSDNQNVSTQSSVTSPESVGRSTLQTALPQPRRELVAVLVNPGNPVSALTMDQIQKLFSGEYSNWNQLGGPDLAIKIVVCADKVKNLEAILRTKAGDNVVRLTFVSLLVPSVDRTRGAIGFLPASNVEQIEYVLKHSAMKKVAIKTDQEAPEVLPSLRSLADGSYPITTAPVAFASDPSVPTALANAMISGN